MSDGEDESPKKAFYYITLDLQKLFEQQNQLNTQLIQISEQTTHKIENLNLINTILITILVVVFCTFLAVKIIKRKNHNK